MRLARNILKSKAARARIKTRRNFPGPDVQTDDELLAAEKERGTTRSKMGTCRMGPNMIRPAWSTTKLRVRGLEALRRRRFGASMPMMI